MNTFKVTNEAQFLAGEDARGALVILEPETHYGLPGLGPSYYEVRLPDGSITWKFVPNGLPGPREFYTRDEDARFFREAIANGLEIRREKLGIGELKLLDSRQLWDIGSSLVKGDPRIIIGDV